MLPFPGNSGQQMRVANMLHGLRRYFHVTFLTFTKKTNINSVKETLLQNYCDEVVVLPSIFHRNYLNQFRHRLKGEIITWVKGYKFSNYLIGELELTRDRILKFIDPKAFDLAFFEYWHAYRLAELFREKKIPTVCDTHDILSQTFKIHLRKQWMPGWLKKRNLKQYKALEEEEAWPAFDLVVGINKLENDLIARKIGKDNAYYCPMGVDITHWPYQWEMPEKPVICYYGSLNSEHNQEAALFVAKEVMPGIWQKFPDAEFWIIGNKPSDKIKALEKDGRIWVSGFVQEPPHFLGKASLAMIPWKGIYGFRSRIIEIMAVGTPVLTTREALHGMDFTDNQEVIYCSQTLKEDWVKSGLSLLEKSEKAQALSKNARSKVEQLYAFDTSYQELAKYCKNHLIKEQGPLNYATIEE